MSIRSLFFVFAIVTLVLFAGALPKSAVAQAQTVALTPQVFPVFEIVASKPDPRYHEMTYCAADSVFFTFEPATKYSPKEYIRFYYLDSDKSIAHDEALLDNLTVIVDDSVTVPKAVLVRTEGTEKVWDIVVTGKMKESYSACLGKLKTQ